MAAKPAQVGADKDAPAGRDWTKLRQTVDARLATLEMYRYSWWVHWRELAEYILPRRYQWLITPNKFNKGSPINQKILDSTGTIAGRTLASGLMSGTTSPVRPWFRLGVEDAELAELAPVKMWLDECTKRMQRVMASSNYYSAKAIQYFDLVVFGTAPMIIYEDNEKVIRCFNPCAGEYYCASGRNFTVDTLYRKFVMTIDQAVREFGIDNVSESTRQAAQSAGRGSQLDREIVIGHAIEPNAEFIAEGGGFGPSGVPRRFSFREVYWEYGASQNLALRVRGFEDCPFGCPRWDTVSNDAYGRSPAMDALPDIKQLQLEQRRKAQAIDKMTNPPLVADVAMKNEPASLLPGAINYVANLGAGTGMRPLFTITPPIQELKIDIQECQARIKDVFFNDLFLMISNLDTVRSATEIDARKEEKLVMLGPVLERNNSEGLDPDIRRIFGIMARNGLLPPPPRELHGVPVKVSYISTLADEQRASATSAIERLFAFAGSLAGAKPDVLDNLNFDEAIDTMADLLNVTPKVLQQDAAIQSIRAARAKQQQAAAMAQASMAAVQGAQTLSQTDVGGGQNALQMMLNGAPAGVA